MATAWSRRIPMAIWYMWKNASLSEEGRGRELRANELTDICYVLRINPMDFADQPEKEEVR